MKKLILTATVIAAFAAASLQTARAGDREWATVGKVLTGVAVAGLVVSAIDHHEPCSVSYSYSVPLTPPPAVVYAPAPRVIYVPPRPVVVAAVPVAVYPQPVLVSPQRFAARPGWRGCW